MKTHLSCHDNQGELHQVPVSDIQFRPSVYGILIKDNQVLLSPQWDGYDLPGGGVNLDESLEEALIREYKEETGLDIKVGRVIHAISSFFYLSKNSNNDKHWNCQMLFYIVEATGGEFSLEYAEDYEKEYMSLPVWMPLNELDGKKYYSGLGKSLPEVVRLALNN